jgi:hypothetical protein
MQDAASATNPRLRVPVSITVASTMMGVALAKSLCDAEIHKPASVYMLPLWGKPHSANQRITTLVAAPFFSEAAGKC